MSGIIEPAIEGILYRILNITWMHRALSCIVQLWLYIQLSVDAIWWSVFLGIPFFTLEQSYDWPGVCLVDFGYVDKIYS